MTECGLRVPQKIKRKKCSNVLVTSSDDKGKGGGAGGGEPRKHLLVSSGVAILFSSIWGNFSDFENF